MPKHEKRIPGDSGAIGAGRGKVKTTVKKLGEEKSNFYFAD